MPTSKTTTLARGAAAALLAGAMMVSAASTAQAQPIANGLIGCDAPGNKQAGGALIGALAGAVLGSNLAKNDRGTGTAIGAVAGAAGGSYVGCRMQRSDAQRNYGYQAPRPAVYSHGGYRLDGAVSPASYVRDGGAFVATTTVNLRSAPTTNSARVGQLRSGERFEALARVRGSEWVLVGQGGVGVGYVHDAYVQPIGGYRYASYR
jgi:uncharacterized protein YgiM (DUF1202 family)